MLLYVASGVGLDWLGELHDPSGGNRMIPLDRIGSSGFNGFTSAKRGNT